MPEEVGFKPSVGPPLPEPPPLLARRQYLKPPIVEGLLQFSFLTPIKWNAATPGRIFERICDAYPSDPETQGILQATFSAQPQPGGQPDFTLGQGGQRIVYKDETGTRLLVVNDRSFSVNSLRPYEGWESLSSRMANAVAALQRVIEMPAIGEVTVRYINQIDMPRSRQTEDFFAYEIYTVRSGVSYLKNFVQHVESLLPDGVTHGGTTFASVQTQAEQTLPVILDIEFKRTIAQGVSISQATEIAVELKQLENSEFESVITDNTRELFQ